MRHFYFSVILIISFTYFLSCKDEPAPTSPAQNSSRDKFTASEKELINDLNKYIKPFNGSSITNDDSDLQVLDKFADAKVIGLGEATHGTKEFFKMKHRLLKYFVEKHGFKIKQDKFSKVRIIANKHPYAK